jgi:ornithine decarboxylase
LDKIAATCAGSATDIKNVKLILRIYANDPTAQCVLSNKYGATEDEWDGLLAHAKRLSMNVSGISFHIGSGACNPDAFTHAIANSRKLYDKASHEYGFDIDVIDLGGGFSYNNIDDMACAVNRAVCQHFPTQPVEIIAEPGRYFAETTADLYTRVTGVRKRNDHIDYTITESLYGSFNCIIYDHSHPTPHAVDIDSENGIVEIRNNSPTKTTTIYGETCDGIDKICDGIQLPELKYGDWLLWKNMGAYTIAGACDFTGIQFTRPYRVYVD